MRCPTLAELPPPPPGRTGWPWTEDCRPLPETMPDGAPWPRISIVTPSYNQGAYIEETLRSILLQGYPDLEYIVIDGGSTDGAVAVIERYAAWLKHWRSEPDDGQAHAINKGLALCTGEIFQFINSDDLLEPGALEHVALAMPGYDAVAGGVRHFGQQRHEMIFPSSLTLDVMVRRQSRFQQPGIWFRLDALNQAGAFDTSLHYVFDFELGLRFFSIFPKINYCDFVCSAFRHHPMSKTMATSEKFNDELVGVYERLALKSQQDDWKKLFAKEIDTINWHRQIERIHALPYARHKKLLLIMSGICQSPKARLNRCSLGNIRKLLINGPVFTCFKAWL